MLHSRSVQAGFERGTGALLLQEIRVLLGHIRFSLVRNIVRNIGGLDCVLPRVPTLHLANIG